MDVRVSAEGLQKRYGPHVAVADVSFSVRAGERVGFLGLNGAGKSSVLRILIGALAPTAGRATVDGYDVTRAPLEVKRRVGYLPETAPLYGELTPREHLRFFARLRGVGPAAADGALDRAGVLTRERSRPISELSKGFRQRVGLALALLGDPPVLILDEPTDGLDPAQRAEVRKLIRALDGSRAVLLSTHLLTEVQEVCSRVLILHEGRVAAELEAAAPDLEARFLEVTSR